MKKKVIKINLLCSISPDLAGFQGSKGFMFLNLELWLKITPLRFFIFVSVGIKSSSMGLCANGHFFSFTKWHFYFCATLSHILLPGAMRSSSYSEWAWGHFGTLARGQNFFSIRVGHILVFFCLILNVLPPSKSPPFSGDLSGEENYPPIASIKSASSSSFSTCFFIFLIVCYLSSIAASNCR